MKIFEAIESEDHKREFNVDGQYKGEINKTTDEKPRIQDQRTRLYHYDQAIVGGGKSDFSFIKQPLSEKIVKRDQPDVRKWAPNKPTRERYKKVLKMYLKHCASF